LAIGERILGADDPEMAQTYNSIAGVYYKQGDYAHAMEYSQKSLAIRELFFGTWHPEIAVSYQNIGRLYYKMEDYANALEYTTKANNIYLKTFGPDHEQSQKTTMMISYLKALAGK
jgi:tetratricopeptide (TPR) repeat protein